MYNGGAVVEESGEMVVYISHVYACRRVCAERTIHRHLPAETDPLIYVPRKLQIGEKLVDVFFRGCWAATIAPRT